MDTEIPEGKKILIVDDVKINALLLKGILKSFNVDVSWAKDGYDAIERVSGEKPDLVIMDFYMPGLNGYETAKKIKGQESKLPIICHTTDYSTIKSKQNREVFNDFIFKPVNKQLLLKKILQYIQ